MPKRPKTFFNVNNSKRLRTDNVIAIHQDDEQAEYVEIQNPKHEPVEYISDNDESNIKDENLSHILDQKQMFTNVTAVPTENNASDQGKSEYLLIFRNIDSRKMYSKILDFCIDVLKYSTLLKDKYFIESHYIFKSVNGSL